MSSRISSERSREILIRQDEKLSQEYIKKAKESKHFWKTIEFLVKSILLSDKYQTGALEAAMRNAETLDLENIEIQKAMKIGSIIGACLTASNKIVNELRKELKDRGVF